LGLFDLLKLHLWPTGLDGHRYALLDCIIRWLLVACVLCHLGNTLVRLFSSCHFPGWTPETRQPLWSGRESALGRRAFAFRSRGDYLRVA